MDESGAASDPLFAVVYCGPNGSGKTGMMQIVEREGLHVFGAHLVPPSQFVNPDLIRKEIQMFASDDERDRAAQADAAQRRKALREQRSTFAFETVMSHPSKLAELQMLKNANYSVYLTFITTKDADINVQRVKQRVLTKTTTGHNVPEDRVRTRYERSLGLLPKAVEIADASYIWDNSYDNVPPTLQVSVEGSDIRLADPLEPWVEQRLLVPLRERQEELDEFENAFGQDGIEVHFPDELAGEYEGRIANLSKHFVALSHADKTVTLHDRSILDAMAGHVYVFDSICAIKYDGSTQAIVLQGGCANI